MSDYVDLDALWHVALLAVAFGAGGVALYAVTIVGASRGGDATVTPAKRAAGIALAAVSLLVVVAAIAFGVWTMLDK